MSMACRCLPTGAYQYWRTRPGVNICAPTPRAWLQASREELAPWINDKDTAGAGNAMGRWPPGAGGGRHAAGAAARRPAHTPEDLAVYLPQRKVLRRRPGVSQPHRFVGQADGQLDTPRWTSCWPDAKFVVPGHGRCPPRRARTCSSRATILFYLRKTMGAAAQGDDAL